MEYQKIDTLCFLFAKGMGLSILGSTFGYEYRRKSSLIKPSKVILPTTTVFVITPSSLNKCCAVKSNI